MTENNKRGIISIDELNLPPKPALAPDIIWGEDFEAFDDKGKIRYLKKLASALNHAADLVQKERNEAYIKVKEMEQLVENAEKRAEIQKQITHNALTNFNAEKQDLIRRIQELEVELKNIDIQFKSSMARLRKYED